MFVFRPEMLDISQLIENTSYLDSRSELSLSFILRKVKREKIYIVNKVKHTAPLSKKQSYIISEISKMSKTRLQGKRVQMIR